MSSAQYAQWEPLMSKTFIRTSVVMLGTERWCLLTP